MEKIRFTLPTPTEKPPQTSPENCSRNAAIKSANLLLGSFPKTDFNDPEIFTRRLVELFLEYPESAVAHVAKHLPLIQKWLHISDVRAALDMRSNTSRWNRVVAETLARRQEPR
jgi:hypothetical protein